MPPQTKRQPNGSTDATTIVLELDGVSYALTLEQVPATIALRVRAETQHSLAWWLDQLAGDDGEPDIDAAAITVWVCELMAYQPGTGPAPKLAEVLERVTYGTQLGTPADPQAVADAAGKDPARGSST